MQIRMRGVGRVEHMSDAATAKWDESTNFARRCYLVEGAPGSPMARAGSGLPDWAEGIQPTDEQIAPGRANFAVLLITVTDYDWLYLSNDGHRRAHTDRAGGRRNARNAMGGPLTCYIYDMVLEKYRACHLSRVSAG